MKLSTCLLLWIFCLQQYCFLGTVRADVDTQKQQSCTLDHKCSDIYATCSNGICDCNRGYYQDVNQNKCLPQRRMFESCIDGKECEGDNVDCIERKCSCNKQHYYANNACHLTCPVGTFGDRCSQICHCVNNNDCSTAGGTCGSEGCAAGYSGDTCQEKCSSGFYGPGCRNSCPGCKYSICDQGNGRCQYGCALGYEKNQASTCTGCADGYKKNKDSICTGCSTGFYGPGCRNSCPGCINSRCDQENGRCLYGCALGYKKNRDSTCTGCADGYKKNKDSICTENIREQGNIIWGDGTNIVLSNQTGCTKSMRKFGTKDQYLCNCKGLDCDFANYGKCKRKKCMSGYGGNFCQKILYNDYLKLNISKEKNVFTDESIQIKNSLDINFEYQYRIHLIKIKCSSPEATITLSIGSEKFCEKKCQQIKECQGDAIGKNLHIQTTSEISLSNVKVFGCSPFWFGEDCDKQCHCAQNSECHKMTGKCSKGCESGRRGSDCQTLNYVNVALHKTASQSSRYPRDSILINNTCKEMSYNFSANLAVDGNTDQQFQRLSCIQTIHQRNPRWQVDLGKEYNISQIRIYNRNYNEDLLNGATIKVDGKSCHSILKATKIIDINCSAIIRGRIIEITKIWGILNFCEVEVLQCLPGYYGNRCSNRCSEWCKDSSCDQWSGQCLLGCVPGYKKDLNKPCTACNVGTYGEECSGTCRCKNINACNKTNGACGWEGCETGYDGISCQDPCPVGTFGDRCSQTCHCKNNNDCSTAVGTCGSEGCAAGYSGDTCQEKCSTGFYGPGCHNSCPGCKDLNCQQRDGRCISGCADGYKNNQGSTCTACNVGTYGKECSGTCRCKNINACNKTNGACGSEGCETGYDGNSCQDPCPVGTFGDRCSQICHCKNNNDCDTIEGTCGTKGCAAGYRGEKCQETCNVGTYGKECSGTCRCKNINACNKTNGACGWEGCETGYDGNSCQDPCPVGTFGDRCSQICHCKNNNDCDTIEGTCGTKGCAAGYRGEKCQETCNVGTYGKECSGTCHCKNINACNKTNGACGWEGCETGYDGNSCQDPCPIGTFGDRCSQICHCKNNDDCSTAGGTCGSEGCAAGYRGDTCQEKCLPGYYGNRCSNRCPEWCKDSSCDQWSGQCLLGCAPGYKEDHNKTCTACNVGTYGKECSGTCHCKNINACNKTNGACGSEGCETGYGGIPCQDPCPVGTFDDRCSQICHCVNNNDCSTAGGTCGSEGCAAGYSGNTCQETCPVGTFGDRCSQICHCVNNNDCSTAVGTCGSEGCAAGYSGDTCQETCPVGTFGDRCSQTCHCKNNNDCSTAVGTCGSEGCAAGYSGDTCQETCPIGTFGDRCSQTCHCKNNNDCSTAVGTCGSEGCAAGYSGDTCQETCLVGTFGDRCSQTCHCVNNNDCNTAVGTCGSEGCAAGYRGDTCQETCPVGTFGDRCSQICHCKNNDDCDTIGGTCRTKGCAAGYRGDTCQEICQIFISRLSAVKDSKYRYRFTCYTNSTSKDLTYEWYWNESQVFTGLSSSIQNGKSQGTIVFDGLKENDSGNLTCHVKSINFMATNIKPIAMKHFPVVELNTTSHIIKDKHPVEVACHLFSMYGTPKLYFKINNTEIQGSTYFLATISEKASVSCYAVNDVGRGEIKTLQISSAIGKQLCPTEIKKNITWPETVENTTANVSCSKGFSGTVHRFCSINVKWEEPDNSSCVKNSILEAKSMLSRIESIGGNLENAVEQLANATTGYMQAKDISETVTSLEIVSRIIKNRTEVSQKVVKGFVDVVNNLVGQNTESAWVKLEDENQLTPVSILKIMEEFGKTAAKRINKTVTIAKENLVFKLQKVDVYTHILFPDTNDTDKQDWTRKGQIFISSNILKDNFEASGSVVMNAVIFRYMKDLLPKSKITSRTLNSYIVAMSLGSRLVNLTEKITVSFSHLVKVNGTPSCNFWDFDKKHSLSVSPKVGGDWSTRGCEVNTTNSTYTVCSCDHLTNFAILMKPVAVDLTDKDKNALSIITKVGCSISIIALAATILIYGILWKYVTFRVNRTQNILLMNLCVSLIIAYLLFLIFVEETEEKIGCKAIAALIHYFLLVSFFTMLAEGIDLAITLIKVFPSRVSRLPWLLLLSWVGPAIIVILTLAITLTDGFGNEHYCWLTQERNVHWAFIAPVIIIILINTICAVLIVKALLSTHFMLRESVKQRLRSGARSIGILTPLLGIAWVFGLLAAHKRLVVFDYIFTVVNSLQGFFIFLSYCVFNRKIQEYLRKKERPNTDTPLEVSSNRNAQGDSGSKSTELIISSKNDF